MTPLYLLFFFFSKSHLLLALCHTCSVPLERRSTCPPFNSTLSFPFASSPGCGHPKFQINCSSQNSSSISINTFPFLLLAHQHNSLSLSLLIDHNNKSNHCFPSPFPKRPIDLSSPFRFSHESCSALAGLRPFCSQTLNCNLTAWQKSLLREPTSLLGGCNRNPSPLNNEDCQKDVLEQLIEFTTSGSIKVEWDPKNDSYFSKCESCKKNNGLCGFNDSDLEKPFLCYQSELDCGAKSTRIIILITLFAITCIFLLATATVAIYWCKGFKFKFKTRALEEEDPTSLFLHRHRSPHLLPPVFSYEELESSTNWFDRKRKIGDGGFGSVYLAQLTDGRIVAVKKLHRLHAASAATKSFCNEILILSSIHHPNLVKLHGYCSDPRGLLLVYDYVPNGTLADHLHGSKSLYRKGSLTWQVRVEIALQTAMAIEYLHFAVDPPVVHRDVTSSNIFLERDMRIKVGDFGLSRLLVFADSSSSSSSSSTGGFVWTGPQGTPGYLDPDYHKSFRLTEKSDVYSFGVVLLELVSGMKAVDLSREKREVSLADLVVSKIQVGALHQVVDPVLVLEGEAMGTVEAVAELAFRCVAADKDDRPDAKEVVAELRRIRSRTRCGHHRGGSCTAPDSAMV